MTEQGIKLAEEVMSNEDLLVQVLFCLPAKSLVRFKCVSKHWLSLISDPKFCSKHTQLNPKSPILGIYFAGKYNTELRSVSLNQPNQKDLPTLPFINNSSSYFDSDLGAICHASNGLFLCFNSVKKPYFVCNITTRTSIVLPQHPLPSGGYYHLDNSAFLVFDPSKSAHFKVVFFNMVVGHHDTILHRDDGYGRKSGTCSHSRCYEIDVYSSETGVWERMYFRAPYASHDLDNMAVCDRTLHWITMEKFHGRFEVDAAKLSFIPMPPNPENLDVYKIRYFGECCGHLFLVYIPCRTSKVFNVFELDKVHGNWTVKYRVNICPLTAVSPNCFQRREENGIAVVTWKFSVLCVVKEEEANEFALLMALPPKKIVSYNLNRNTIKVLDESAKRLDYSSCTFVRTFPFMANLSLV